MFDVPSGPPYEMPELQTQSLAFFFIVLKSSDPSTSPVDWANRPTLTHFDHQD